MKDLEGKVGHNCEFRSKGDDSEHALRIGTITKVTSKTVHVVDATRITFKIAPSLLATVTAPQGSQPPPMSCETGASIPPLI